MQGIFVIRDVTAVKAFKIHELENIISLNNEQLFAQLCVQQTKMCLATHEIETRVLSSRVSVLV
jgi:hypothetical protein